MLPPVRGGTFLGLCAWALLALPAAAEPPEAAPIEVAPTDEARALSLAASAFEYRDFRRVVEILEPWVKPPRIVDPGRRKEAHRLLGISHHILGNRERAEEELSQLLLADPEHKLDPFVVPPAVIETFDRVRERMRPLLDDLARQNPKAPPKKLPGLALSSPIFAYAPFGLSHFLALDAPEWGAVWLSLEVVGLAANILGFVLAASLPEPRLVREEAFNDPGDQAAYARATALQFGGAALFGAAWIASGVHGHMLWNQRAASLGSRLTPTSGAGALTLHFE